MSNVNTIEIIKKWYIKLGFPKKYDAEFYEALNRIEISDTTTYETYDKNEEDGKRNLLSYLFMCEDLSRRYSEKGIGEDILIDTLCDIVRWTDTWSDLKGELYFGELPWFTGHMSVKLFKIGRLQYRMNRAAYVIPEKGIEKGDDVIEIHIPSDGPLDTDKCIESLNLAREFFAKFFPEFKYEYFSTYSWLLDRTLKELLPEDSNIIKFQELFEIVPGTDIKSDAILGYVFKWKTERSDIQNCECKSSFAKKVKEHVLAGKDFYATLGIIKR